MSVAIHFIEGLSCPFFVCEVCGKRITDQARAMAAWGELLTDKREHGQLTPAHVHNGACLDIFETRLPEGQRLMTDELGTHIAFLANNSQARQQKPGLRIVAFRASSPALAPDPGPMARFKALIADPSTFGVIAQRLAKGETLRQVSRSWRIPHRRLTAFITAQVVADREKALRQEQPRDLI